MPKITLFAMNGSYAHSSLAIRVLKKSLNGAGFDCVSLVEATLRHRTEQVLAALVGEDADLYGFSCYIWNIKEMLALAADLRALLPGCRILLGGPEVSHDTGRFTALPFVDAVITGEGERAIVEAAKTVKQGEALPKIIQGTLDPDFTKKGIAYEKTYPVTPLVYYESSRGCPYSCAFCLSSAASGVRAKTAEDTLADLLEFEDFPAPFTVKLVDRTFNFDKKRAAAIWRGLLDEKYTKCYHFEISAALLDEECFEILSKFPPGKVRLEIGLQSTNRETLAAISRQTDAEKVVAAAKRLVEMGNVNVHLDLIAGLPFEGMDSFKKSFDGAYFACHDLQLGFLKLLHGTALRKRAAEYGIVAAAEPPYTVLKTNWLSFAELHRLHGVADLLDRLREKGRFQGALDFMLPRVDSPFDFYSGFLDHLTAATGQAVQKIAQRDLFKHLAEYGQKQLNPQNGATFLDLLRQDFAAAEARKPPF